MIGLALSFGVYAQVSIPSYYNRRTLVGRCFSRTVFTTVLEFDLHTWAPHIMLPIHDQSMTRHAQYNPLHNVRKTLRTIHAHAILKCDVPPLTLQFISVTAFLPTSNLRWRMPRSPAVVHASIPHAKRHCDSHVGNCWTASGNRHCSLSLTICSKTRLPLVVGILCYLGTVPSESPSDVCTGCWFRLRSSHRPWS